ncbi:hypothetical protein TraAM80_00392, partial [Trypanosoma rangeli]
PQPLSPPREDRCLTRRTAGAHGRGARWKSRPGQFGRPRGQRPIELVRVDQEEEGGELASRFSQQEARRLHCFSILAVERTPDNDAGGFYKEGFKVGRGAVIWKRRG